MKTTEVMMGDGGVTESGSVIKLHSCVLGGQKALNEREGGQRVGTARPYGRNSVQELKNMKVVKEI